MIKWLRVPLHPDWTNAENTIIWNSNFTFKFSNFQIQNELQTKISNSRFQMFKFKTNFCVFRFLLQIKPTFKTHQHFFFSSFSLTLFLVPLRQRNHKKTLFTLGENNFDERRLSCTCLNFGEILFAGTKRAVPGGQYRSILPARVANQNTEFAAYCPLAELAI